MSNEAGPPRILKRSTRHLIPIEVSCEDDEANVPSVVDSTKNSFDPSKDKETIADASNSSAIDNKRRSRGSETANRRNTFLSSDPHLGI